MTSQTGQHMQMLPSISRSKGNQAMKFGPLMKYSVRNMRKMRKMRQRDQIQTLFRFLKKLYIKQKQVINTLVLIYFRRSRLKHAIKTNFITFQTADPEICAILYLYKRVWEQLLHHIFCMIFKDKKYFPCYTLLAEQISLLPL